MSRFWIKKSQKNIQLIFDSIKQNILRHLDELEEKENAELKKCFSEMFLAKGGTALPVGTVRTWKGKKFVKTAPNTWKPKYDGEGRGAKLAIADIKKKIAACEDAHEMMMIVLSNRERFSDKDGNPLPVVRQLSDFIGDAQGGGGSGGERGSSGNGGSHGDDGGNNDDNNAKKDFAMLTDVLATGKSACVKNADLGEIIVDAGTTGKAGYGLKHIIEQRYTKDGKNKHEITALLHLIIDAARDGEVIADVSKNVDGNEVGTLSIEKNGIIAFVSKKRKFKDEKFIITGFDNSSKKKEAEDAIKTVIADYGYAPEFVNVKKQVGAVIASLSTTIPQSAEKSREGKPPKEYSREKARETIRSWANQNVFEEAWGMTREEIFSKYDTSLTPIALLPSGWVSIFKNIEDSLIYCSEAYFIDHMVNHHPEIDFSDYASIQNILDTSKEVYKDERSESVLFAENKNGKKEFLVIKKDENNNIIFYKTFYYGRKIPSKLKKISPASVSTQQGNNSGEGGRSSISHSEKPNPAASISARPDTSLSNNSAEKSSPQEEFEAVKKRYKGTDTWLKAPNGEKTKLSERQWLQVRTPSFKAWFGDWEGDPENASKVIDENGEPKVMYHFTRVKTIGTLATKIVNRDIVIDEYGSSNFSDIGLFLTPDSDFSGAYNVSYRKEPFEFFVKGHFFEPKNDDVFLYARKFIESEYGEKVSEILKQKENDEIDGYAYGEILDDDIQKIADEIENGKLEEIGEILESPEFTDFLYDENFSGVDTGENILVFDPKSSLKSASDNEGSFDPQSDDIRKAIMDVFAVIRAQNEAGKRALVEASRELFYSLQKGA